MNFSHRSPAANPFSSSSCVNQPPVRTTGAALSCRGCLSVAADQAMQGRRPPHHPATTYQTKNLSHCFVHTTRLHRAQPLHSLNSRNLQCVILDPARPQTRPETAASDHCLATAPRTTWECPDQIHRCPLPAARARSPHPVAQAALGPMLRPKTILPAARHRGRAVDCLRPSAHPPALLAANAVREGASPRAVACQHPIDQRPLVPRSKAAGIEPRRHSVNLQRSAPGCSRAHPAHPPSAVDPRLHACAAPTRRRCSCAHPAHPPPPVDPRLHACAAPTRRLRQAAGMRRALLERCAPQPDPSGRNLWGTASARAAPTRRRCPVDARGSRPIRQASGAKECCPRLYRLERNPF